MERIGKSTVARREQLGAIDELVPPFERNANHKVADEQNEVDKAHVQRGVTLADCVIEINKRLDEARLQEVNRSIFEVPSNLRKLDPDAFIPRIVSVGPYHRNKEHLQGMEKQKRRILLHVLDRTKSSLEPFINVMFKREEDARNYYGKHFENFSCQEFVEMMLLDSCFILELLNVAANGITNCGYNLDDPLFAKWGMSLYMQCDLLMLENQLPLLVLNRLFPLTRGQSIMEMNVSVEQLALKFFNSVLPGLSANLMEFTQFRRNEQDRLHLLDVVHHALHTFSICKLSQSNRGDRQIQLDVLDLAQLRSSKRSTSQSNGEDKQLRQHVLDLALPPLISSSTSSRTNREDKQSFQKAVNSVTSLRDASVEFRKKNSTNFMDIDFYQGVLNIPPFVIHDFTKSIIVNLMVFEQYYPRCSNNYITSYALFMDGLINSSKDVEYLCAKRIIVHSLGSNEEVANLFNGLRKYIVNRTNDSNLAKVSLDLSKHFNKHVRSGVTLWDCMIEVDKKPNDLLPKQGDHSIFEVPSRIQALQPDAFIPHVVSIGPYHRDQKCLQEMEKHKQRLLSRVLERSKIPLYLLMEKIFQLEGTTRSFYDKPLKNFSSQEFAEMMLLDACFILELLNVATNGIEKCGYNSDDPLFSGRGISPFIKRDLLMIENQLPLLVINELFHITKVQSMKSDSVVDLALKFFDSVLPKLSKNSPICRRNDQQPCLHLLDVIRQAISPSNICESSEASFQDHQSRFNLIEIVKKALCPFSWYKSPQINCEDNQPFQTTMHSVTRLRGTSVEFKKNDSTKFTDVKFRAGVLYIPPLLIHDFTKSIFLNLMVFEQYYPQCSNYVTSYVSFMDGLINSAKDVEYLYEKGIIKHNLGSNEDVANLFNNLRKEIVFHTNDYYLAKVSQDLDEHFNKKWQTRKAALKHEYLKDPWKVISLVAATFLIIFTLAQTAYSMLGYHHPRS